MDEPQLFPNQPKPSEHVEKHATHETAIKAVNTQLNNIATRLKILEERYTTLRKKSQLTEQNIIQAEKDDTEETQLLNESLTDVKKTVKNLVDKVTLLKGEVEHFVSRNEFSVVKKYVDFWEPMDFITRKEVNDFLRKKFKE